MPRPASIGVSEAIEDQAFRDTILPPELVGAPLGDPMVLDALERWASAEAADVLGQLFIVAAIVLLVTAIPAWLMHGRGRRTRRPDAPPRAGRPPPGAVPRMPKRGSPLASEDELPVPAPWLARRVLSLAGDGRILVASDFDGTLASLVSETGGGATIVPAARRALRRLAVAPDVQVVLLSGRTVLDLAGRARVGGIRYLGDHGAEFGPSPTWLPARRARRPSASRPARPRSPWSSASGSRCHRPSQRSG